VKASAFRLNGVPAHTALALEGCRISRQMTPAGPVEIVSADARPRAFPTRVAETLGMCLKAGRAHSVRADGGSLVYPADSVCIRPPGCVWSSDATPAGFVSIDLPLRSLPEEARSGRMTFVAPDAIPGLRHAARTLLASRVGLESDHVVAELVAAAIGLGVLVSSGLQDDGAGLRGARRAREFLTAHAHENPTLDEVARQAGMNRFVLLRWFRRAFGTTPHAYLTAVRIDRARALLAAGMRCVEAGAVTGFADQAHFTRQFKRLTGVTPAVYAANPRPDPRRGYP
jgi:AraC-like DNA-binding protein